MPKTACPTRRGELLNFLPGDPCDRRDDQLSDAVSMRDLHRLLSQIND
jgi:hypothetical protein